MEKWGKRFLAFALGIFLALLLCMSISKVIVFVSNFFGVEYTEARVALYLAAAVGIGFLGVGIGKFVLTSNAPLPIAGVLLPNWLYDSEYVKYLGIADKSVIKENESLKQDIEELSNLIEDLNNDGKEKQALIEQTQYVSEIFIRHHNNVSRLIRSLLHLWEEKQEYWLKEFCNNILCECVTTLTKDRADKSSSIYFVNESDTELEMFAYNRIEVLSSRTRKFKMGQGFAGYIWEANTPDIVNDVSTDERFVGVFAPRNDYGSILGYPIRIQSKVIGVLCITSQQVNGFEQDDLIMVNFYADICGLARLCDIISSRNKAERS